MSGSEMQPLLIEIGTEEMPAGVSLRLGEALRRAVEALFAGASIESGPLHSGVTPRRLLLHIPDCPVMQADRQETVWGPPDRVAFRDSSPTKAAEGFARKVGLPLDNFTLEERGDGKGRYMRAVRRVRGRGVSDILAEAMPDILRKLPAPKAMRWRQGAARTDAFIRPIRWIVARLGDAVIPFSYAGVDAGRESAGHRVHGGRGELDVHDPFGWLYRQGVIADRDQRRQSIREQLGSVSAGEGVDVVDDETLLEEVVDLTEWPQVLAGRYDEQFLRLPAEVSRIELKHHQRCFAARTVDGGVSNLFFAVANIESKAPSVVAAGNERVVNARLADAAFYFDRDPKETLEQRTGRLNSVVFQEGLGMVGDQIQRIRAFILDNAEGLGVDANTAQRAAYLCKSDLTTGLVGEFPELQGYMGGIYAGMNGEGPEVAKAIAEHYRPQSAEDALPESPIACAIGIAERADKLLGYFHIGRISTASADPYALRRSAIGLIRLLVEKGQEIDMSLPGLIDESARQWNQQRVTISISDETKQAVYAFIIERLLVMAERLKMSRPAIEAALGSSIHRPMHLGAIRIRALMQYIRTGAGQAVAEVHKRTNNILKNKVLSRQSVDEELLSEDAEKALYAALRKAESLIPADTIEAELNALAELRGPVDRFFTDVMVMVDDDRIRNNRLALLVRLRELLLLVADFSCLPVTGDTEVKPAAVSKA